MSQLRARTPSPSTCGPEAAHRKLPGELDAGGAPTPAVAETLAAALSAGAASPLDDVLCDAPIPLLSKVSTTAPSAKKREVSNPGFSPTRHARVKPRSSFRQH